MDGGHVTVSSQSAVKPTGYANLVSLAVTLPLLGMYVLSVLALVWLWDSELLERFSPSGISWIALLYFVLLTVTSWYSKGVFFFLAPLIILSVPNAINDLLPSFAMGPMDEEGAAYFSFFTHVDIYLVLGLIRHRCAPSRPVSRIEAGLILFASGYYLLGYLTAFIVSESSFGSFVYAAYQLRYLLLAIALVHLSAENFRFYQFFLAGTLLAASLVVVESLIFTELRLGSLFNHRLVSGNLGQNVYGNLLAALAASTYALYNSRARQEKVLCLLFFVLTLLFSAAAFMTETRMSALSLLAGVLIFHCAFPRREYLGRLTIAMFIFFVLFSPLSPLSPLSLANLGQPYASATVETRFILWRGTLEMIQEAPWSGIGLGQWNFIKGQYHIDWTIMLDAHNDYLQFLAAYGVPVGLVFLVIMYLPAWLRGGRCYFHSREDLQPLFPYLIIPMVMSMSAISNSNGHKHQFFAILVMISVAIISHPRFKNGYQTEGPAL
jgi:O-antigen ligase